MVAARSASASSTAARRSGGPSSATTSSTPPASVGAQRDLEPGERAAPDGLLGRLAEDLVERDGGVLAELVRVRDVEVDLDIVS